MTDTFGTRAPGGLDGGPVIGIVAITGSDQALTGVVRGVYVSGGSGSLCADFANGTTGTITGLVTGTAYPFAITKIYDTGTDITGFVLY